MSGLEKEIIFSFVMIIHVNAEACAELSGGTLTKGDQRVETDTGPCAQVAGTGTRQLKCVKNNTFLLKPQRKRWRHIQREALKDLPQFQPISPITDRRQEALCAGRLKMTIAEQKWRTVNSDKEDYFTFYPEAFRLLFVFGKNIMIFGRHRKSWKWVNHRIDILNMPRAILSIIVNSH